MGESVLPHQVIQCQGLVVVPGHVVGDDGVAVPVHDGAEIELAPVGKVELRDVRLPDCVLLLGGEVLCQYVLVDFGLLARLIEILLSSYPRFDLQPPHPVQDILPRCLHSELAHQLVGYPPVSVDLIEGVEQEDNFLINFLVSDFGFARFPLQPFVKGCTRNAQLPTEPENAVFMGQFLYCEILG